MEYILEMENICKTFPGIVALNRVNLSVKPGSAMAIVGENGAGKSTLIKILSGAYTPDSGIIRINEKQFGFMTPSRSITNGISVIYQELNLVPQLTVYENVFLGKEKTKSGFLSKSVMREETQKILDSLKIDINPEESVKNLSSGYKQLVEVAKSIAQKVKLFVLDEPTSSLSNSEVSALFSVLRELKQRGTSMIYISHRLEEIFEICDEVTVLRDGIVVGTQKIQDVSRQSLIKLMVGRELSETYPGNEYIGIDEPYLEVKHLSLGSVRDISFTLNKGEILGFAGLVGAGRTETMRALFGADGKPSGEIKLEGKALNIKEPKDAIEAGIGLLPEDRKLQGLNLVASIAKNISISNLDKLKQAFLISDKKERELVRHYIKLLEIKTPSELKIARELSGGNQQKVVLAKWLVKNCRVLILDEPTRGIDVGSKQEIYRLMRDLSEKGISIIMVTSDMPELLGMSDRIVVMHNNKIKATFNRDEFSQEKILDMASGGLG